MEKSVKKIPLATLDDLFTTQKDRDRVGEIFSLPIEKISNFKNHPFKVLKNEEMELMVDSIKENGVTEPVIVRPTKNGYEMISGHRRKKACELLGIKNIPAIIKELTDDEATILMVDSNHHREKILPSEKAFAYRMKLEAEKRQGKRTDLTCDQVGDKLSGKKSVEKLAESVGDSKSNIQRYIRLTYLIPKILEKVDSGEIKLTPAKEISFLTEQEQNWLFESMIRYSSTPSISQAQELKELSKNGELDESKIKELLSQKKPNQVENLKLSIDQLKTKMPKGLKQYEYIEQIFKALDFYNKYHQKTKSIDSR